jgi:hypothetical protein
VCATQIRGDPDATAARGTQVRAMSTNTALTIVSIVVVVAVVAAALWAFVVAPFWVPWHSRH